MAAELLTITQQAWNNTVAESPYATAFHAFDWAQMTAEHFGADMQTFSAVDDERQWLIPVFQGLPWQRDGEAQTAIIGYGGPLPIHQPKPGDNHELQRSSNVLRSLQFELGLHTLQATLYPANFWQPTSVSPDVSFGKTYKVALPADAESMFSQVLSGTIRTAIRKAEKSGVVVRQLAANDALQSQALSLLSNTQEAVGSSYQTEESLLHAINTLDSPDARAATHIAEVDERMIGMSVCIYNRQEMFHMFHGWDRTYAALCGNQALHWAMIKQGISLGLGSYNMGESHTDEIARAKLQWGGKTAIVPRIHLTT